MFRKTTSFWVQHPTTAFFLLLLLLVNLCAGKNNSNRSDGIATSRLKRDEKHRVMDLTSRRPVLTKKEQRRLEKQVRKKIPHEDLQLLLVDNVQSDYSPKEMVSHLFHEWKIGADFANRGILILVVMEQNRIEIEFGDGLAHFMDAEWCQELLITKVVPMFRQYKYAVGLQEAFDAVEKLLLAHKSLPRPSYRNGKWARFATMIGLPVGLFAGRARREPDPGYGPPFDPPDDDSDAYDNWTDKKQKKGSRGAQSGNPANTRNDRQKSANRGSANQEESQHQRSSTRRQFGFHLDDLVRLFATSRPRHSCGGNPTNFKRGSVSSNTFNSPPRPLHEEAVCQKQRERTNAYNPLDQSTTRTSSANTRSDDSTSTTAGTGRSQNEDTGHRTSPTSGTTGSSTSGRKITKTVPSSSSGGGATWSSRTTTRMRSNLAPTTTGVKKRSNPIMGAGATWSSSSYKAQKNRSNKPSHGAGASW